MPVRMFTDDGKLIVHRRVDIDPVAKRAAALRDANQARFAEDKSHVGSITSDILMMWLKEAGVSYNDKRAAAEVVKRKLLDGENAALRIDQRSF